MKKLLTFLSFGACLLIANAIHAANYYLSSSEGNDSYTSTQAQNPATPWKSLDKLNSFFSSLRPGDSVLFKCGDTFYGKLVIGQSGNSGSPIVLASYGAGSKPVISGLTPVTTWTNIGGNIWESTSAVKSSNSMLNMVTINDNFQPIGRWPKLTDPNQGYLKIDSRSGNNSITSSGLSGIPNFSGGQIVTRRNHWIIDVDNITSNSGTTVNFSNSDNAYDIQSNWGFFFQNHSNACTQQGDWYYNNSSRKLGMFSAGTPSGIKISTIDTLVTINSNSYITFNNLSFTGSNQITFFLTLAQNIYIDNCLITLSGQNGIEMTNAGLDQNKTQNITISNSTISYINNNGISAKKAKYISIINTLFDNVGMTAGMGQNGDAQYFGVSYLGDNATFTNNIMNSIGYTAVYFSGKNSKISNNYIHDFCVVKDDGAGIYTYGNDVTGTIISGNIVLNGIGNTFGTPGGNYAEGIYADDQTRNLTIIGNTVANGADRGIYIHNSHEIQIQNNTCYNNNNNQIHFAHDDISPSDPIRNINMTGNFFISKTSDQNVARFSTISNDIRSFGVADNNYYARPINEPTTLNIPGTNNTLSGWQNFSGQDINSKISPKSITNLNDLRFEFNATSSPKTVNLGATYIDVTGKSYSGSITLQPYTSAVLIYQSGTVSNQPPVANAGPDQNFFLPANSVTLNGSGSDADGSIASYQWAKISGPSQFTIVSPTQAQTVINNLVQGVYQFELTVTDNLGATGKDTVTVTVNPANNQPPTANAGVNQNITLPANTVTLNGSGSDPDGSIASYQWTKISGPSQFSIVSPTQAQTVINSLVQGVYQFQLKVTDNQGATATSTVTITVNPAPNQPPTATAGSNQNITLPVNSATLNGSGSDPDGSIASYQWTKISGPSQFTIVSPSQAQTVINGLVQGVYQFQLKVTDNQGATATSTVTITVNPANQSPAADAGVNQTITLPVNSVTLSGSGIDPDGNIASYQWTKISGPSQFNIINPAQAQTVINNLVQGTYQFQLTVTDNQGATASDTVQIVVNPANQPPVANAGSNQTITLPTNSVTLSGSAYDPDGAITGYNWTKISGPGQFNIVSPSQSQTTINNLVQGIYQFQLTVTDNQGATASSVVSITVTTVPNQEPIADAGPNQNITLPANSVILTGSGTDPDGIITAYRWKKISGPSSGYINNSNSATTRISGLIQGVYQYELRVTDNNGAYGRDTVTVTVNPANKPPVADAGPNQNITLPTDSVTLTGSGTDPDGSISSYQWSYVSGPSQYNIQAPSQAVTVINNLVKGTYQFQLTVTDNSGATGSGIVVITVNEGTNQPPVADAGKNQSITLPVNSVTLTGSGTDTNGTITSYQWVKISGPDPFTIVSPSQAQTVISDLSEGTYQFQLTVTDNNGATGIAIVFVTVNAASNQSPVANAGADQTITLPVNSVILSGSGNDPDGSIVSYQWSKISGPSPFSFVSDTLAQTTVNSLVQGTYQFQLTVTDNSGATGTSVVTITVNPAPNQNPIANAGNDVTIYLPVNSVTLTGSGWDPDGNIVSYQWEKILGPSSFSIVSPAQAQTVINNLAQGIYQFQLTVTDNNGATAKDTVQVIVNPANIPPVANAGADKNITLPVNSVTLTGSGTDTDGSITSYHWTKISGPGQFTIVSPSRAQTIISRLVQGVYQFQLTVTDNLGATGTDTVTITVNPEANQPPTANAGINQNITLPVNSVTLTGSGSDPDGSISSYQWTKVSGPNQFNIVSPSQAQTVVNNLAQGVYQFQLTVTDNRGATATATVTVTVNPAPNQPPTANAGINQNITLPVNSVTLTGSGSDPDGSISSYQWTKVSGPNQFNIVSPSQAQTVVNNLAQGVYQFQLTVTDNRGATATATVTVTVNPAPNQPPAANAGADQTITLPVNSVTLSGSGTDPDGTIVSYSWSRIAGPSQFSIVSPAQAQTVVNNLVQGVYVFQLTVRDNSGATATDLVTITVNAALPSTPPVANAGPDLVVVLPVPNITLSGSGSTSNGSITSYSWTQLSGPSQSAIVSPSYSQTSVLNLTAGIYLFELTVTDNKGLKGKDTVQVTVQNSPNRNATSTSVKLYPNPATTTITIAIEGATEKTTGYIKIYSVSGNTVYQEEFTRDQFNMTKQIDVSSYANGVYFVSITIDSNTQTTLKFVKQ